jgi:hypothetical protein
MLFEVIKYIFAQSVRIFMLFIKLIFVVFIIGLILGAPIQFVLDCIMFITHPILFLGHIKDNLLLSELYYIKYNMTSYIKDYIFYTYDIQHDKLNYQQDYSYIKNVMLYSSNEAAHVTRTTALVVSDPNNQLPNGYLVEGGNQPLARNIADALRSHYTAGRHMTNSMFSRSPETEEFIIHYLMYNDYDKYLRLMENFEVHWRNIYNNIELREGIRNLN